MLWAYSSSFGKFRVYRPAWILGATAVDVFNRLWLSSSSRVMPARLRSVCFLLPRDLARKWEVPFAKGASIPRNLEDVLQTGPHALSEASPWQGEIRGRKAAKGRDWTEFSEVGVGRVTPGKALHCGLH